jgi:hypothetical protein
MICSGIVENGLLLPRISECYYGFRSTGRIKKDDHDNDNSKHGARKLERLHEVVAAGDT